MWGVLGSGGLSLVGAPVLRRGLYWLRGGVARWKRWLVRCQLGKLLLIVVLGEVVQHLVLVKLVLLELLHLGLHCPHTLH